MDLMDWMQTREGQRSPARKGRYRDTRGDCTKANNRRLQKNYGGSSNTYGRLTLQKKLKGHRGCVNTLSFNNAGDKLVSGSDDCHVKIWDPHECRLLHSYHAQHSANIFCAKFLPFTSDDQIVSCAADGEVRWAVLSTNVITPYFCNGDRVKKLAVDPSSSYVFFSCSEDCTVRMYDVREKHDCSQRMGCENGIIVDLRTGDPGVTGVGPSRPVRLNSLAINDANPNYLVVGGSDPILRLYDRRMLGHQGCVYRFRPENLAAQQHIRRHITGVNYNYDGTRILATYGGDLVYLFDVSDTMRGTQPMQTINVPPPLDENAMGDAGEERSVLQVMDMMITEANEVKMKEKEKENEEEKKTNEEEEGNEDKEEEEEEESKTGKGKEKGMADVQTPAVIRGDFLQKYQGHVNVQTVKEINFLGPESNFVASGSDDGRIFIWETDTAKLVNILVGDSDVVNCVRSHPLGYPLMASSGIENNVKIWLPTAEAPNPLEDADDIIQENQKTLTDEPAPFRMSSRMMLNIMQMLAERRRDAAETDDDGEVECIQS